ncbi:MAG: AMP-binding protein [Meiothermus sp.]|uniref:AMP-binding protein n=1 Tax=Meiothermus sp. TaxID=1955249 RepID=UPI0025E2BCD8|nr:AMP-binding protein [Meiothermus sp.]MCS7059184.1 AMP-binding protein [Meiothermus sp.]MCS7194840.1 AMP-binding protein [Meiothermus sp.]MDW8090372.1 AMP-binding protein [Meiothermus sp.]MDW8481126.1 AMP-binding protein [Meiothermus sp.]
MAQSRKLTTVQTALRVLAYLAEHPEGVEAARLAAFLGKSLSTAYALLASLVAEGFAEREGSLYKLSRTALAKPSAPLVEPERLSDALEELYLRTRERTYLALLDREGRLRLSTRGRQGLPKLSGVEGVIAEGFHALALGKAVLAFLEPEVQAGHLQNLRAYTPLTLTDPLTLEEELSKVRRMGFAVEIEEHALGLSSLAAPIFDPEGRVLGALGVVVPSRRFPYAFTRLVQAVQEVAKAASSYHPTEPAVVASEPLSQPLESPPDPSPTPACEEKAVPAPPRLVAEANLRDYRAEYERSLRDPEGFWAGWARRFVWFSPWKEVRCLEPPHHRWFVGAETNITYNALDRYAEGPRRNHLALIALAGDGAVHKLTYRELRDLVSRLAGGLRALGIGLGDRVAVYMPTGLEMALTFLACARIGAVHVAVPAGMGAQALRERLLDTGAKLLVAADRMYQGGRVLPFASLIEEAVQGLDLEVLWFSRGGNARSLEFWELVEAHRPNTPALPVDSEHPLFILYTSGSTGKPKGVVHVHGGYMVGITYHLRTLFDLKEGDVMWATADLSWIVGHSYALYAPLLEGLTTVLRAERLDYPDPSSFYETLEACGVNVLLTSPTWLRAFRRHGEEWAKDADLSALRLVGCVGEYLAPEVWRWARNHLAHVLDNWWQTETGGPCLSTPVCMPAKPGKAGLPLPGVEMRVVDGLGRELPPGEKGHLVICRPFPHFMRTFWNDDRRYVEQWSRIPGCYATGDIAVRDEEGYIALLGRSDDVIKAGELRIGTAEIEGAMLAHPAVAEAAAIGVPDPEGGEVVKVYVVLKTREASLEARAVLSDKLKSHLRRQLGNLSLATEVLIVERLPRTKSGKIMRRLLKAQELGVDPGDLSTLEP